MRKSEGVLGQMISLQPLDARCPLRQVANTWLQVLIVDVAWPVTNLCSWSGQSEPEQPALCLAWSVGTPLTSFSRWSVGLAMDNVLASEAAHLP